MQLYQGEAGMEGGGGRRGGGGGGRREEGGGKLDDMGQKKVDRQNYWQQTEHARLRF